MPKASAIGVYCGSSFGTEDAYRSVAQAVGHAIGGSGRTLVYGGGRVGLMGVVADATIKAGGKVLGYIPEHLLGTEIANAEATRLLVVDSMHTRKRLMFENADGFLILPGGIGTLEEFFEVLTWRQLSLHDKPIVLVNTAGYWAPLIALLEHCIDRKLARPTMRGLYAVADTAEAAIDLIDAAPAPRVADRPEHF